MSSMRIRQGYLDREEEVQRLFAETELQFLGEEFATYPGLFVHLGYPVAHPEVYLDELQPIFAQLMEDFDDETIQARREKERQEREYSFTEEIGFQWQEDIDYWEEQAQQKRERQQEELWADELEQEEQRRVNWAEASQDDWPDEGETIWF